MTSELRYDFPEVKVASVRHGDAATGCTLLHFEAGASCAVDVRGGAVSARELSTVALSDGWGEVDALCFTGGSTWGLDAACGVMHRLSEERGFSVEFDDIPAVPCAAVYDFTGRDDEVFPDAELGMAAYDALESGKVALGRAGAGTNVTVGSYFGDERAHPSGQGAAFIDAGGIKMLAVAVVNCTGNIYDRKGKLLRGGEPASDLLLRRLANEKPGAGTRGGNTLLAAVVTNIALDRLALSRVAMMAQASAARVVEPFHTPEDGDVVFALSTSSRRPPQDYGVGDLGVLAGRALQDAIVAAVTSVDE
jgi:L-aminopeptidase/D-esterase-like protein